MLNSYSQDLRMCLHLLVTNATFRGMHVKGGPTIGFSRELHVRRLWESNSELLRSQVRPRASKVMEPSRQGLSSRVAGKPSENGFKGSGGSTWSTSVCGPLRVMESSTLFTGVRISPKVGSATNGFPSTGPKLCIFRLYMVENGSLNTWCLPTWVDIILLLGLPGPGIGYSVALCAPGIWSLVTRIIFLLL